MSAINDALKQAEKDQKEQAVIHVPGLVVKNQGLGVGMFLVFLAGVLALGFFLWTERQHRIRQSADLSDQVAGLNQRYQDLMVLINNNNAYLDTRVQLEIMEIQSSLKTLSARLDGTKLDKDVLRTEIAAFQDETKNQLYFLNKRLHNVEHDHSTLADRLEELKTDRHPSAADASAATT